MNSVLSIIFALIFLFITIFIKFKIVYRVKELTPKYYIPISVVLIILLSLAVDKIDGMILDAGDIDDEYADHAVITLSVIAGFAV